MELLKIERIVEDILRKVPNTRDDDYELIAEYYSRVCPSVLDIPFRYVILGHKDFNIPNFKSIERARRKVQAKYPELMSKKTKEKRKKAERIYVSYSLDIEMDDNHE